MLGLALILMVCLLINVSSNDTSSEEVLQKDKVIYDKWINIDNNVNNLIKSATKAILPHMMEYSSKMNLSSDCLQQTMHVMSGLVKREYWAFSFIDSSAKMVDGILSGTLSNFGNYDQCLSIAVPHAGKEKENKVEFRGNYCILEIKPPSLPLEKSLKNSKRKEQFRNFSKSLSIMQPLLPFSDLIAIEGARLGVCVPSGCNKNDIKEVARFASEQLIFTINLKSCQTQEMKRYNLTVVTIMCFFCFLFGLSILGSSFYFYSSRNKTYFESNIFQILQAFSIQSNFTSLFKETDPEKMIPCLDGIRFLTVVWIVYFHTYLFSIVALYLHGNVLDFAKTFDEFLPQIFLNGPLSVETFFLLGGFLNCYSRASESEKKSKETNFFIRLRKRIFRILPLYASAILLEILLFSVISNPKPHTLEKETEKCAKNWWKNVLFIHNFQNVDEICAGQTWYLGADMQFYVVALFTIPVLLKRPKIGIALNGSIILLSIIYNGLFTWIKEYPATLMFYDVEVVLQYREEYPRPFSHAGSYFLGVLLAYFICKRKPLKIAQKVRIFCWILSFVLSTVSVFGVKEWKARKSEPPTLAESVLYAGFSKIAFSLGVGWVVFCCATGYGGIVNTFLSWKVWTPFSRLTYAIFLVSLTIQIANLAALRTVPIVSHNLLARRFLADFNISCFLAVGLFLLIENPFVQVERNIFSKAECTKKKKPDIVRIGSLNSALEEKSAV